MRREHGVGQRQQGRRDVWFVGIDIQPGTGDEAITQGRNQRCLVHHAAARDIHQPALGAERLQYGGIDQLASRRATRCGHHQPVHRLRQRDGIGVVIPGEVGARLAGAVGDGHAERRGTLRDLHADVAQAQHAQTRTGQRRTVGARTGEAPFAHRAIELRIAARQCQHQAQRMIGHGVVIHAGCIGEGDAVLAGVGKIDAFVAGAKTANDFQLRHALHQCHAGATAAIGDDGPHG